MKQCYGLCDRCAWMANGGCSMWNGYDSEEDGVVRRQVQTEEE